MAEEETPQAERRLVAVRLFSDLDDAMEAVRAADLLDLGAVLRNRQLPSDEDDTFEVEWVLELSTDPPVETE